jgi:hypothetical protein
MVLTRNQFKLMRLQDQSKSTIIESPLTSCCTSTHVQLPSHGPLPDREEEASPSCARLSCQFPTKSQSFLYNRNDSVPSASPMPHVGHEPGGAGSAQDRARQPLHASHFLVAVQTMEGIAALRRMCQEGSYPLDCCCDVADDEGLVTLEFASLSGTLAALLTLARRAGLQPHETSPQAVLCLLWILHAFNSQYGSDLKTICHRYTMLNPNPEEAFNHLESCLPELQTAFLIRCQWNVNLQCECCPDLVEAWQDLHNLPCFAETCHAIQSPVPADSSSLQPQKESARSKRPRQSPGNDNLQNEIIERNVKRMWPFRDIVNGLLPRFGFKSNFGRGDSKDTPTASTSCAPPYNFTA